MSTVLRRFKQESPRMFGGLSRTEWRELAKQLGVERGRNTMDTVRNVRKYVEDKKGHSAPWLTYLREIVAEKITDLTK